MNEKWTNEEMAYLMIKRSEGIPWKEIVVGLDVKFNIVRSRKSIEQKYYSINNPAKMKLYRQREQNKIPKTRTLKRNRVNPTNTLVKWTEEKVDFIHSLTGSKWDKIDSFAAKYGVVLNHRQYYYGLFQLKPQHHVAETTEVIVSEVTGKTTPTELELKEISLEKRFLRTRFRWDEEEELNLLIKFYELSVDEARDYFQRPFYALAKRLELIIDGTEPHHPNLLMKAAKEIKSRKSAAKPPSFWQRRKAAKKAKQAKKLASKVAKLNKKLAKVE